MFIVVLSRNPALYSTQSLVRAAQKRGHYVRVIDHLQCDLVIEEGQCRVYYQNVELTDVNAIIPRIGSSATSYGASVIRQFESSGIYTTLSSDALLRSRDKVSSLQLLAKNGIQVPKTVIPSNNYTMPEMINQIEGYPKIIKLAKGTHGLGVILSKDRQNAESILESFQKVKQSVLVQEFIKEAGGADVRVLIVNDKIVGVMKRQAQEGEFRSNLHRGGTSKVIPLTDIEKQVALKAARVMGLQVSGVDMLQSKRGPMILEVNASPGLEGIETTTGVDIAGKVIDMINQNVKANWRS